MVKVIPSVRKFMSVAPITVSPSTPRSEALAVMRSRKIHHMPVCDGGKVVGIVSDGDLYEIEATAPQKQTLRECMHPKPFVVSPEQPIDEVVKGLTTLRTSRAAVVVDNGRVVGMFTATDGLRAFADYLNRAAR